MTVFLPSFAYFATSRFNFLIAQNSIRFARYQSRLIQEFPLSCALTRKQNPEFRTNMWDPRPTLQFNGDPNACHINNFQHNANRRRAQPWRKTSPFPSPMHLLHAPKQNPAQMHLFRASV